jgi:Fe-Mn family superoxide dismutase
MKYNHIEGLVSAVALSEHVKLWDGYKAMIKRVDEKEVHNSTQALDDNLRHTFWAQSYALNGIELHSLFFENLIPGGSEPYLGFLNCINDKFSGLEELNQRLFDASLMSRGWTLLSKNRYTSDVRIITVDSHEEGLITGYDPILVLDMWEHAYWMDWGSNKKGYISALLNNIDWKVVSERFMR